MTGVTKDLLEEEIASSIEIAKEVAKTFTAEDIQNGIWFQRLLLQVTKSYKHHARAEYFQKKYLELTKDEIADKLIALAAKYSAITGDVTGVTATSGQLFSVTSLGASWSLFIGSIGLEMLCFAQIQMRLILDLSVVYEPALNPEDVIMIFGYALGIAPTEILGQAVSRVSTPTLTRTAIRTYISKETLVAVQDFGRQIGFKILQRSLIKYSIPVASAMVGSTYNYVTTQAIGKFAKAHFRSQIAIEDEIEVIQKQTYLQKTKSYLGSFFPSKESTSVKILVQKDYPNCASVILAEYKFCPECGSIFDK
jgi:hypothetical protein